MRRRDTDRRTAGRVVRTRAEGLERRLLMAVDLLADLNADTSSANPNAFATAGDGAVFFRADDGRHGPELFVTDGTAAGTSLGRDIRPGRAHGIILDAPTYNPPGLVAAGGAVDFAADD